MSSATTGTDESNRPKESSTTPTEARDAGELKWTPFPPPNVDAILSKMPLVPLTMEQLCAPITDSEEEEEEKVEEGDQKIDMHGVQQNSERQFKTTADVLTVAHSPENFSFSISLNSSVHNDDVAGIKVPACSAAAATVNTSTMTHGSKRSGGQPLSSFINNSRSEHFDDSKKPRGKINAQTTNPRSKQSMGKSSRLPKLETQLRNFVDLTDSSEEVVHHLRQSDSDHVSTSSLKNTSLSCSTASSGRLDAKPLSPTHKTDVFEQQDDEFDILCVGIDLDTIDDFSDVESEAGPSHTNNSHSAASPSKTMNAITHSSNVATYSGQQSAELSPEKIKTYTKHGSLKGKASVRSDSQLTKKGSVSDFTSRLQTSNNIARPDAQIPSASTKWEHNAPSRSKFAYPTSTIEREKKNSGVKRPNDFDVSLRTKQPRLEFTSQPHFRKTSTSSTIDSSLKVDKGTSHRTSTHSARTFIVAPPTTTSAPHSASHEAASGTDSGIGSTASQKSHLTTENCPMCNTRFPSWWVCYTHISMSSCTAVSLISNCICMIVNGFTYTCHILIGILKQNSYYLLRYEQVDADQHLTQCLQAVMDLEIENDLVLL